MAETHLLRARRRGGEHRAEAWVLAGVVVAATVSAVQVVRWLAERFEVQTQWPTLVVAGRLACWAPRAFGVTLGSSVWRRPEELAAVLLVGDVVALFRMIGGSVPWAGRPLWIAVPVVEGLLPGGFCVTALLWVFRRGFAAGTSVRHAILVDSLELIAQGASVLPTRLVVRGSYRAPPPAGELLLQAAAQSRAHLRLTPEGTTSHE
jgi:hypothetical protein